MGRDVAAPSRKKCGYGSKPKVPFWGWLPPHYSLFKRLFGFSPGYRGFDPQPCVSNVANSCFRFSRYDLSLRTLDDLFVPLV